MHAWVHSEQKWSFEWARVGFLAWWMIFWRKRVFGFLHVFASEEKLDDECMLRSTQNKMMRMGFWILRAFAFEEKLIVSPAWKCLFFERCFQLLLFRATFFVLSVFPLFCFLRFGGRGDRAGVGVGWEGDFSTLVAGQGRRSSQPADRSTPCVGY